MFSRKQANICVTVLFQSTPEIGVRFLGFSLFSFMKTLLKSIIYCQTVPLDYLLMYVAKTVCQAFLLPILT